jgi:hypothetical protein
VVRKAKTELGREGEKLVNDRRDDGATRMDEKKDWGRGKKERRGHGGVKRKARRRAEERRVGPCLR